MRTLISFLAALLAVSSSAANADGAKAVTRETIQNAALTHLILTGHAQVTLTNQTGVTVYLYIDGDYAGRALKNLFCTSQVKAGTHALTATTDDGRSISKSVTLQTGESFTWTISEE